jgi:copper chaperone
MKREKAIALDLTTMGSPMLEIEGDFSMQLFTVTGMTCGHCVRAVTAAITSRDAAAAVRIDLATGRVEVDSDFPRAELAAAITGEGYALAGA